MRRIFWSRSFPKAPVMWEVRAKESGYITGIDTEACGIASVMLGAGRSKKEDLIDYSAGIHLVKKYGDRVEKDQVLAVLYTSDEKLCRDAEDKIQKAYTIGSEPAEPKKLIYARITKNEVARF